MAKKKTKKIQLDMRITLILFALIPMVITALILSIVLVRTSSDELKNSTRNSMLSIIEQTGAGFDAVASKNEDALKTFVQSPIITEYLKNPDDTAIGQKAQEYTVNYFNSLSGWEGIYLSDWNSQVLTHPNEGAIGMIMREGESLANLQNAILSAEGGVYNVGILTSPASGQLIMSVYVPVFDGDTPIGYVGGGIYVNGIAEKFADVSSLGLSSAYTYFVDKDGIMLYHPDASKIGNAVENEAVKGLVAKLAAGEHPKPECVEYMYKGAAKYAAYYVGANEAYIAVLTADEKDVMSNIQTVIYIAVVLLLVCVAVFAIFAIFVAKKVSDPLAEVAKATEILGTGDVTVDCNTKSNIKETDSIIVAFQALKSALMTSMTNVKDSANALNTAIISVDGMTSNNVDSVTQINQAIDEVASTSQAVAESAQTMAEKATELGDDIEVLNTNVANLFDASLTIKNVNNEATDCMKSVYDGAKESVDAVQNISEIIQQTNTAIEEIGSAVQAIESIATQTNLLSLNASIEAARAGEAGRGFAVVADEIRALADSSAESAKEIKRIIENVIDLSNGTVKISNRVYEVIVKEQEDIENAQSKFNILSESVEASIKEIDTIKNMADVLDKIKVEMSNATTDLGAISEELGASAQEVAASCQTVTNACTDTQASTEEMRAINENMGTAIEFFKL